MRATSQCAVTTDERIAMRGRRLFGATGILQRQRCGWPHPESPDRRTVVGWLACVITSFVIGGTVGTKEMSIGLAAAVLIDAA